MVLQWAGPAIKIVAVKDRNELIVVLGTQSLVCFCWQKFSDEDVPPAHYAVVSLQLNGALFPGFSRNFVASPAAKACLFP